jgi:archaellum biogenesis ATPase FlaH
MEGSSMTYHVVQKYPGLKVLPFDHPCVVNSIPVYIDKTDRRIKLEDYYPRKVILTKALNKGNLEPCVSMTTLDGNGTSQLRSPSSATGALQPEGANKRRIDAIDISNQFDPEERFNGEDLYHLDVSLVKDLVEDLIPSGEISLIAGQGDTGKTTLYFQLCLSIITGQSHFLGHKLNAKHNSVLVIATEDSKHRIATKIQKQLTKYDQESTSLKNLIVHVTGDDLLIRLSKELKNKEFDLIVLDALGDLLLDDINSQTAVRQFYSNLEKLIREFHTTFLLVHHVGKTQNRSKRANVLGSTAIVDRSRNAILLEKDEKNNTRWISILKSNNISDEKKNKQTYLEFDPETLTYSIAVARTEEHRIESPKRMQESKESSPKPGRKMDLEKLNEARRLRQEGKTEEEIGQILGKNKSTISRWFKKYPTYDLTKDYGDI